MAFALYPILEKLGLREPNSEKKDGELLQVLGTEYGRKKFGDDVWARVARTRVEKFNDGTQNAFGEEYVIFDDCRFRSEFDVFPEALRIWLECGEEVRKGRAEYWRTNTGHQSENDLRDYLTRFDLVIDTELSTQDETLDAVLEAIGRKWGFNV
jgi:hypothetical protein